LLACSATMLSIWFCLLDLGLNLGFCSSRLLVRIAKQVSLTTIGRMCLLTTFSCSSSKPTVQNLSAAIMLSTLVLKRPLRSGCTNITTQRVSLQRRQSESALIGKRMVSSKDSAQTTNMRLGTERSLPRLVSVATSQRMLSRRSRW